MFEHKLKLPQLEPLSLVATLISAYPEEDYYVYEKPAESWHIALGVQAALVLTPTTTTLRRFGHPAVNEPWEGDISAIARRFSQNEGGDGWNLYGQAAFEYAAHVQGISNGRFSEEGWPLLSLMVPRAEITFRDGSAAIHAREVDTLMAIRTLLIKGVQPYSDDRSPFLIDLESGKEDYQRVATQVINEARAGLYQKITLSRQVCLPKHQRIDMLGTYLRARPRHTPSRSFLIKFMDREVLGFSPELVMSCNRQTVVTQPVAGTRALLARSTGTEDDTIVSQNLGLRRDLMNDPKEIAEHAMTVRESLNDMNPICQPNTTGVSEFMEIHERGSVQHISSMVIGMLKDGKDAWDAFDVLFPSVTACGGPKAAAIKVIPQLEKQPRGLFSGAILRFNSQEFEAPMVLRSAFQEPGKSWIQAGAGTMALSTPEREFEETSEKLASVAPYVVLEN